MKKLIFITTLLCLSFSLFAFPDMRVTEHGDEIIKIQDDELFMFLEPVENSEEETVRHYTITPDWNLIDDENNNWGQIKETEESYIISFEENNEGFSSTIEFNKRTFCFTKTETFRSKYLIQTNYYDDYGRISKVIVKNFYGGETVYLIEYHGLSLKTKSITCYDSDTDYFIMKYEETNGNLVYSAKYESNELYRENFVEYYEDSDVVKKETEINQQGIKIDEYSKERKLISSIYKSKDGNSVYVNERYEYDSNGNRIRAYSLDEKDQIIFTQVQIYNDKNQLVQEILKDEKTGYVSKDVVEYVSDIPIRQLVYRNDVLTFVYEIQSVDGKDNCFCYNYSNPDYFRITHCYGDDDRFNLVKEEFYEIDEGKIALTKKYSYNNRNQIQRIKTYTSENKLSDWKSYEYYDDGITLKTIYKFEDGKIIYIKDFDSEGKQISLADFEEDSGKITFYYALKFNEVGMYSLNNEYVLKNLAIDIDKLPEYAKQSENGYYIDWNEKSDAKVTKYDFTQEKEAWSLLKNLEKENKIIPGEHIILENVNNETVRYIFKLTEKGFVDFDFCYRLDFKDK